MTFMQVIQQLIPENGPFPNNPSLPFLLYKQAVDSVGLKPETFEEIFFRNGWKNSWRNGIYDFHHYHSNTHEVLGIYSGSCDVQIGGENGQIFHVQKGDVLIIPVGISHKNIRCSKDFGCVGAYPFAIAYDMNYGKESEKARALKNIQSTPLPETDPIFGKKGPLFQTW